MQKPLLEQTTGTRMHKKEIIFIKEGYTLHVGKESYRAGDTFTAPVDLADLLIREGKALPYKPCETPEPKSNV